jgi:ABC-type Fe2+-enterobactin transport system substrate-binding protein
MANGTFLALAFAVLLREDMRGEKKEWCWEVTLPRGEFTLQFSPLTILTTQVTVAAGEFSHHHRQST